MNELSPMAAGAAARALEVVYRPLASLTPDPRNARTHPKRQIEQIIASIRSLRFTNPILADEQGNLIAGHGRLPSGLECRIDIATTRNPQSAQFGRSFASFKRSQARPS